jgi:hypothetical protein
VAKWTTSTPWNHFSLTIHPKEMSHHQVPSHNKSGNTSMNVKPIPTYDHGINFTFEDAQFEPVPHYEESQPLGCTCGENDCICFNDDV